MTHAFTIYLNSLHHRGRRHIIIKTNQLTVLLIFPCKEKKKKIDYATYYKLFFTAFRAYRAIISIYTLSISYLIVLIKYYKFTESCTELSAFTNGYSLGTPLKKTRISLRFTLPLHNTFSTGGRCPKKISVVFYSKHHTDWSKTPH
jgi:hypothetical protein